MKMHKEIRTKTGCISRIHIERAAREAGYSMASHHCHPYFELYYVENGACRFTIDDNMYDLHKGDYILIPPETFHYTRYLFGACKRADLYFRSEDISEAALSALPQGAVFFSQARIFQTPGAYREQMSALISRMTADIAAAAGFSPNYLSRKFREAAGIGIHEYLAFTRLQHAAAELISTDDTITQIALRCGFSDSNYFKDVFKKKYGVTPREYRSGI